jgi:hypothetical protein
MIAIMNEIEKMNELVESDGIIDDARESDTYEYFERRERARDSVPAFYCIPSIQYANSGLNTSRSHRSSDVSSLNRATNSRDMYFNAHARTML